MNHIILVFVFLVITNFFGAFEVPKILVAGFMISIALLKVAEKSLFRNIIVLIFLGLFASMISCYTFRGQSLLESLKANTNYFNLLFYFGLLYFKPSVVQIEKTILGLTVLFIVCYIIQYLIYPVVIFSGADREFLGDQVRIRLAGQGIVSLGYFFSINKFLTEKRSKSKYLLIAIGAIAVIFLMGFRTMLFGVFIFTFVLVIRVQGFSRRLFTQGLSILLLAIILIQVPPFSNIIEDMQERQKTDNLSNADYVRVLQWGYYTTSHFKNGTEFFFGSGTPYRPASTTGVGGSAYGRHMEGLVDSHLNWVDWGLISSSWIIGIPTVLFMIAMAIIAIRQKRAKAFKYLSVWYFYILLISFTTLEFVRPGNFEIHALALYTITVTGITTKYRKNIILNENRNSYLS